METTSSSAKENFTDAQKIIHSWLNDKITDQQLISYAQQNCNQLNCNENNSNHSFFLLLFNTLYFMDQERIKLNQTSNICSAFNNQDKSDLIKTIYDIEQDTLKSSYLIHDFIKASKITTKDISKIKKLIELVC